MTKPPPAILLKAPKAILTEGQQAVVDLLEQSLEQAQQGLINTIGIIVCMKGGFATVMAGTQAADLNLGCDSLKKKILDAVESNDTPRRSSIIMGRS